MSAAQLAVPVPVLLVTAVFGLLLGSFLNVCISRLPHGASIAWPGSHCPACGAPIRPLDNIPLLSYMLLGGKCRNCRAPISPRYPLVEAGYALLATASVAYWGLSPAGVAAAVFCFFALALLVTDAETMLLPDALTLSGAALGVAASTLLHPSAPAHAALMSVASAAVCAGAIWLVRAAYWLVRRREGLGLGDVKLMLLLGAWLGWQQALLAFWFGSVGAALWGVVLLVEAGRHTPDRGGMRLPYGSFLCGGALVALFAGPGLLGWYLRLFR